VAKTQHEIGTGSKLQLNIMRLLNKVWELLENTLILCRVHFACFQKEEIRSIG